MYVKYVFVMMMMSSANRIHVQLLLGFGFFLTDGIKTILENCCFKWIKLHYFFFPLTGFVIYFTYGIRNSTEADRTGSDDFNKDVLVCKPDSSSTPEKEAFLRDCVVEEPLQEKEEASDS